MFVLDGAAIDRYMENEKYLPLDICKYELEKEKHDSEEMHIKEERKQREMNFQEELRKIMEAEKVSCLFYFSTWYFWIQAVEQLSHNS